MWLFSILLLFGLSLTSVFSSFRQISQLLEVQNGGQWGSWGLRVMCPAGSYAEGYAIKFHGYRGNLDDTALNNIRLFCSGSHEIDGNVNSLTWGKWSGLAKCRRGQYLVQFQMRVQDPQGRGDDTAANAVKFKCRGKKDLNGGTELVTSSAMHGLVGSWGKWSHPCRYNSAICGLQIKFESLFKRWYTKIDYTALNDVRFFCCE